MSVEPHAHQGAICPFVLNSAREPEESKGSEGSTDRLSFALRIPSADGDPTNLNREYLECLRAKKQYNDGSRFPANRSGR